MTYQIRQVEQKDLDQLVALCGRHADFEGSEYEPVGKKGALKKALFSKKAELQALVVTQGQQLVGYTTFIRQFSTWNAAYYMYMDCLYLDPDYRRMGIGKILLERVRQYAQLHQCQEIQWQTPLTNQRAIQFYRREGAVVKEKARCFLACHDQGN